MRKFIIAFATLALLTLFPLTGCGGDQTEEMKAPVDGFMSALQAGDIEQMKTFADESLFEDGGSFAEFNTIQSMDEELAKAVGISSSDLSDKTKQAVDDYVKDMMSNMITSYEIKDATVESDTTGTVTADVTFGFDPEAATDLDVNAEVEKISQDYMSKNMAELQQIYLDGGQDALMVKVLDDLAGDILKLYTDKVMETGEVTETVVFGVEQKDGNWVIVSDNGSF